MNRDVDLSDQRTSDVDHSHQTRALLVRWVHSQMVQGAAEMMT